MPRIRRLPINTHPENTAFLLRHGNGYSAEQFQALRKIRVTGGSRQILATLALREQAFGHHPVRSALMQGTRRLACKRPGSANAPDGQERGSGNGRVST